MANFYKKSPSTDDSASIRAGEKIADEAAQVGPGRKESAGNVAARLCTGEEEKADGTRAPGGEMAGEKNFGARKEKSGVEVVGVKERKVDISWLVRGKKKSSQLGRSMIEMLGVLAIIGVLSIAGIAGYSKAMESHRINKLRDQVVTVFQNIATAVGNGQFTSQFADPAVADALHILPPEMGTARNCHHALGGFCWLDTTTNSRGEYDNVFLRLRDLPPSACIAIATLEIVAPGVGVGVYINSTNSIAIASSTCTTEDGEKTCNFAKARTIAQATQECRGKLNAVLIVFGNKIW